MARERELKVVIVGDAASARAAMRQFGNEAEATASRLSRVGDKMADAGKKASAFITLPVLAGMAAATKASSDLNEQMSKTDQVFGEAAAEVHKFAAGAAKDIGQSKRQAEEAVGTFGNLFNQLGIGTRESAKLSVELTRLASDFASFHNADPTEVLVAMTAAFRGEYDAVQRFVPVINAAAVEQQALKMGLADSTKELDAQDKALATHALLVEGAGKATGDFDRTQDSLANKTRIAKARLEDTAATLGNRLIPIALKAADAAMVLFDAFGSLDGAMQSLILVGLGVAAAIGPILTVAGNVAKGVAGLTKAVQFLATSMAAAKVASAGLGLSIAGLAAGYIAYKVAVDAINKANDEFNDGAAVAVNNAALFDGRTKETAKSLKEQAVAAYTAGVALNTHLDVQKGAAIVGKAMADEQDRARRVLGELAEQTTVSRERIVELANSMGINLGAMSDEARTKLAGAIAEISRGVTPTARLAEVQETLASKTATAAEQFDAFKTAIDAALGSVLSEREAAIALAEKVVALGEAIEENGTKTGLATEEQRNLTSALIDVVRAAENEVEAITRSGQISTDAASQKAALVQRLEELKQKYPQLAGPIDEYIARIRSIPEAPTTTPQVNIAPASAALEKLRQQYLAFLNMPNAQGPTVFGPVGGTMGPVVKHAGGEVLHAGGPAGHTHGRRRPPLAADEVPAVLQRGEYVIRRESVRAIGLPTLDRLNRMNAARWRPLDAMRFRRLDQPLGEEDAPPVSPHGGKLKSFDAGRAVYADGWVFTVAGWGWDLQTPAEKGGLRFRPTARLDVSQVEDRRSPVVRRSPARYLHEGGIVGGQPASSTVAPASSSTVAEAGGITAAPAPGPDQAGFDYDRLAAAVAGAIRPTHSRKVDNHFGPIYGLTLAEVEAAADRKARLAALGGE